MLQFHFQLAWQYVFPRFWWRVRQKSSRWLYSYTRELSECFKGNSTHSCIWVICFLHPTISSNAVAFYSFPISVHFVVCGVSFLVEPSTGAFSTSFPSLSPGGDFTLFVAFTSILT